MLIAKAGLEYMLIKVWDIIEIQIIPWRFYGWHKMQKSSERRLFKINNSFLNRDKRLSYSERTLCFVMSLWKKCIIHIIDTKDI